MPCVLILRRVQRETHASGEPPNRRGHVIGVIKNLAPAHARKTRGVFALIDVPDMAVEPAQRLFLEKDYSAYIGPPDPGRGGHHEKTLRQRSVRLDVQVLRALLPPADKPKLVDMFQEGFFVREADRISVPFDTLRQAFIVDRDLALEIGPDRKIRRKLQTIEQPAPQPEEEPA